MRRPRHNNDHLTKALAVRLDRGASELNTFPVVFAVGLAVLYGSCLFTMKFSDAILHTSPITELSPSQQISAMVR